METVIFIADHQVPYQDKKAVRLSQRYIEDVQPDITVFGGDVLDFPNFTTKFLREQKSPEEVLKQIKVARGYLEHAVMNSKRVVFIDGNHEERLRTYILDKAPELTAFAKKDRPLTIGSLLGVEGVEYLGPYGEAFVYHGFVFKHGEAVGRNPARTELENEGSSGMSGHVHRFNRASRTDRAGAHAWWTVGCLCNIRGLNVPPGRVSGHSRVRNQQQGFATIYFTRKHFAVQTTDIIEGTLITPGGVEF